MNRDPLYLLFYILVFVIIVWLLLQFVARI